MGWFDGPVHLLGPHERAHHEAAKALGCSGSVWFDKREGIYRWQTYVDSDRQACIIDLAGVLAGGFDSDSDMADVRQMCRRSKLDLGELTKIARPYAARGRRLGAGPPEAPPGSKNKPAKKRGWVYWG